MAESVAERAEWQAEDGAGCVEDRGDPTQRHHADCKLGAEHRHRGWNFSYLGRGDDAGEDRQCGNSPTGPPDIVSLIDGAEIQTAGNTRLTLTIALSYGGRSEITAAARRIAEDVLAGTLAIGNIDEAALSSRLYTADMPDPDLLIRTSGEERISNFLLWQLAYSELVFTDVLWPDFSEEHLTNAVQEFHNRERRYGATGG